MVKAILIINGVKINIISFYYDIHQETRNGKVTAFPRFKKLHIVIESQKGLDLFQWAISHRETKQIVIHILPIILGGKTRKLFFYDCMLANFTLNFRATGKEPMTETLEIIADGMKDSESGDEYSHPLRVTYDKKAVAPTVIDEEEEILEPKILSQYWLDADEKTKIEETEINSNSVLFLKVKNIEENEELSIVLEDADNNPDNNIRLTGIVNSNGEVFLQQ